MIEFIRADESVSFPGLLVAFALMAVSGCVSVQERGLDSDIELQALDPAATDERHVRPRCPIRHMYVCEHKLPTDPGICYCTPEPTILRLPGADGLRRGF